MREGYVFNRDIVAAQENGWALQHLSQQTAVPIGSLMWQMYQPRRVLDDLWLCAAIVAQCRSIIDPKRGRQH